MLGLYYKVALFKPELRKCSSRTRLVTQSCDFRAGAAEVYFAYYLVLKCCENVVGALNETLWNDRAPPKTDTLKISTEAKQGVSAVPHTLALP